MVHDRAIAVVAFLLYLSGLVRAQQTAVVLGPCDLATAHSEAVQAFFRPTCLR